MDVPLRQPAHGWIEVITGSMFSGKSEELIRRLRRAQIARQRVQIFKPAFDNRFASSDIVSHSEMRIQGVNVGSSAELLRLVNDDTEVVGIDLPVTVDLRVEDTVPGIKGATASAQVKPARTETGLVVQVPPFINVGDRIRVSTETGEYQSRA